MMKRILFIAPSSFPVIDAEAIVNMKLLTAMSKSHNFQIDLISRKCDWENYPTETLDFYNIKVESLNIIEAERTINIRTIMLHIKALFLFGCVFKGAHWAAAALPTVKKLIKENKYDCVLTKNGSSYLIGEYVKKHYGIKFLATWNDPYPDIKYPHPYGKGKKAKVSMWDRMQIRIMRHYPDIHIFPSDRLRDYMLSYLKISKNDTAVIPHVVEETNANISYRKTDVLRIIHSGNLRYPRDPRLFISAFYKFIKTKPNANIQITIMGVLDEEIESIVKDYNIEKYFIFRKPVPYLESLTELSKYDIAMIIEAQCEEGVFLPTKVTDFMQCKKTIYAISPRIGVLNDLYREGFIEYFSENTNEESIYNTLCSIYDDFINGEIAENKNICPKYTSKEIVEQYLSLI